MRFRFFFRSLKNTIGLMLNTLGIARDIVLLTVSREGEQLYAKLFKGKLPTSYMNEIKCLRTIHK